MDTLWTRALCITWTVLTWCLAAALCVLLVIAVDLFSRPKSRFHTTGSLLHAYKRDVMTMVIRLIKSRKLKKDFDNFMQAQERFLLKEIRNNENTQYGRDHQFGRIHSLADFRRLHPVTSYSHYSEYIERAENGQTDAIFGKRKLLMLACSSGTTGKPKHIPVSSGFEESMLEMFLGLAMFQPSMKGGRSPLYKELAILCQPHWRYTPTGLRIGPISGLYFAKPPALAQYATPFEAHVVNTETEAVYVSLLFALRDRDLIRIDAGFASILYNTMKFIENNWRDLVADVRSGRLKEDLDVSEEHRRAINKCLLPDPERAQELEVEFEKGFEAILPRIFPKLKFLGALLSGTSMSLYKDKTLPYLGHLKPLSLVYGSSEAFFSVNIRRPGEEPAYVVMPSMALVEFLPVDESGAPPEGVQPLLADQVEIGCLYEPVITTNAGLYRYRQGDVVKVVSFYRQAPCIDFVFRAGQMLNVHMEKLSEDSFFAALRAAVDRWSGVTLREFTTAESVLDPSPRRGAPYYLVFLELEQGEVTEKQTDMIDEILCEQNYVYKSFRVKDAIAPMKVLLVTPGAFQQYRQLQFETTTAFVAQFKQPRVLRTSRQVQFFVEHVSGH